MKLTERNIQGRLFMERYRRGMILPNFTPPQWFECDVFELTDAGYFREYEVKITRSDFKADAKKTHGLSWRDAQAGKTALTKHHRLAMADVRGPAQFWYVTPVGLLTPEELPPWAGLIEISAAITEFSRFIQMGEHEMKKAPRLHGEKASDKIRAQLLTSCYYRLHQKQLCLFAANEPEDYSI